MKFLFTWNSRGRINTRYFWFPSKECAEAYARWVFNHQGTSVKVTNLNGNEYG